LNYHTNKLKIKFQNFKNKSYYNNISNSNPVNSDLKKATKKLLDYIIIENPPLRQPDVLKIIEDKEKWKIPIF